MMENFLTHDDIVTFFSDMDVSVQILQQHQGSQYTDINGQQAVAAFAEFSGHIPFPNTEGDLREAAAALKRKLRAARGDANTVLVRSMVATSSPTGVSLFAHCAFVKAFVEVDPRTERVRRLVERGECCNVGDVAHALTLGYRCARPTWENDAFIYLQNASEFQVNRAPLLGIFPEGTNIKFEAHIDQYQDDGSVRVWSPSVADILATDWIILAHEV